MPATARKINKDEPHPSGDERYKAVDLTIRKFKYEKDALLEVLNSAQETFGYLSRDLLVYISNQLGVRMAQVFSIYTSLPSISPAQASTAGLVFLRALTREVRMNLMRCFCGRTLRAAPAIPNNAGCSRTPYWTEARPTRCRMPFPARP